MRDEKAGFELRVLARVLVLVISKVGKVWFVVASTGVENLACLFGFWMQCTGRLEIFAHSVFIPGVASVLQGRPDVV